MSLILFVAALPEARAQWAVIDVGAIAQLIQEVQTLRQQLMTAQAQLNQAEDALAARIANIEAEQAQSEEDKTPILTELFRLQTAP